MKRIKICHISEASSGGVYTHLTQIAELLGPNFEQTFVLSSLKNQDLKKSDSFFGHRLKVIDILNGINPYSDLLSLIKIVRFLNKQEFDIIHCHSSKAGAIGRIAALTQTQAKVLYTPHCFAIHEFNGEFRNGIYAIIEKLLTKITNVVICVSYGEQKLGIERKIITSENSKVIPNGVKLLLHKDKLVKEQRRLTFIKENFSNDIKYLVGFIGRISIQKNPAHLLKSLAKTKNESIAAVFVGDGELMDEMKQLANDLNLEHRVKFMGHLNNVDEILSIINVFVSTSLWESMPYSILEAMAASIPVIGTKISGTDEILNQNSGILIDINDINGLASVLDNLCEDKNYRELLSLQACQYVENKYSLDNMIKNLGELYSYITNN